MKTEGYIANHLSTALVQVTALVLTIHVYRQHTMSGTIQKKKDSLSDFQGLIFVFECGVKIIRHAKGDSHTTRIVLHCYESLWNFQYRELRIMPV